MIRTERIFHLFYTRRELDYFHTKNVVNLEVIHRHLSLSSNEGFHLEQNQDSIGIVVFTKKKKTYYLKIIFIANYQLLRTYYVQALYTTYIIFFSVVCSIQAKRVFVTAQCQYPFLQARKPRSKDAHVFQVTSETVRGLRFEAARVRLQNLLRTLCPALPSTNLHPSSSQNQGCGLGSEVFLTFSSSWDIHLWL